MTDPDYQRFVGFVDSSENGVISGWAVDLENLDQPTEVDVYLSGRRMCTVIADRGRPDLLELFNGRMHYGFSCELEETGPP